VLYLAYIFKVTTGYTNIKYTIQNYYFTRSKILHNLHHMQLIIRLQIILGVFLKLPTVIIRLVMSVLLSIRSQGSTRFPLN